MLLFQWFFTNLPLLRRNLVWLFASIMLFGQWVPNFLTMAVISLAIGGLLNVAIRFCAGIAATMLFIPLSPIILKIPKDETDLTERENDRAFYLLFWAQQFFVLPGSYYFFVSNLDLSDMQAQIILAASGAEYLYFLLLAKPMDKAAVFYSDILSGLLLAACTLSAGFFGSFFLKIPKGSNHGGFFADSAVYDSYNMTTVLLLLIASLYLVGSPIVIARVNRARNIAVGRGKTPAIGGLGESDEDGCGGVRKRLCLNRVFFFARGLVAP
ncbi:MAG: hypothetical protein ACXWRE_13285, partial [Pseudobdellovibrionaceae bacterium]